MRCDEIFRGGNWAAGEGVNADGAFYVNCTRGVRKVAIPLPVERFSGRFVQIEAHVKGFNLERGPRGYHGPKVMFPYKSKGRAWYPELPKEFGSYDWKKLAQVEVFPDDATELFLVLGIENATGEFWVDDVAIYAVEEVPDDPPLAAPRNEVADSIARGPYFNTHREGGFRGVMSPGDRELNDDDFRTLASWKVNLLRRQINVPRPAAEESANWYFEGLSNRLLRTERELALCKKYGMKMCIDLHSGPSTVRNKHAGNSLPNDYDTTDLRRAWRMIAERFRDDPSVYGYDIMNEPAVLVSAWDRIFREAVAEIRLIDKKTPVITECLNYYYPEELNVIYSPHFYSPHTLTHFGVGPMGRVRWSYGNYVNGEFLNKDQLRVYLLPIIEFAQKHPKARVFIGEFSCVLWSKGAENYIADCIDLFEEYGFDWSYHAFREWPPWDVEYDHDKDYTVGKYIRATGDTPRKLALLKGLSRNCTCNQSK